MSNDNEFYDLDDPDVAKAWDMIFKMPNILIRQLNKRASRDMLKGKKGASGTYYMTMDILKMKEG